MQLHSPAKLAKSRAVSTIWPGAYSQPLSDSIVGRIEQIIADQRGVGENGRIARRRTEQVIEIEGTAAANQLREQILQSGGIKKFGVIPELIGRIERSQMIKIGVGVVGRPSRDVQKMLLPRNGLKERILRCARFVELAKEYRSFAVDGSELAGEGDRSSPIGPGGERRLGKVERRLLEIALGIAREKPFGPRCAGSAGKIQCRLVLPYERNLVRRRATHHTNP
jgi:hypothetical protein